MKKQVFSRNSVYFDHFHYKRIARGKARMALIIPLFFGLYFGNVTETNATSNSLYVGNFSILQTKLSGRVLDSDSKPIAGASIKLVGTNINAETNSNGFFELNSNSINNNSKVSISYVGFKTQLVSLGSSRNLNIVLQTEASDLDEVVVVGYGTQKKENLTGSVDVISNKMLSDRPANNVADLIKGVSPNMNINMGMRGGEPGASARWNIRGVGSINGNSAPLVLVDGVEMDINSLDPESVESISILKDASASAVYGSRAPFGVVLITTKKGQKSESVQISYNNNLAGARPINLASFIDSYTWATAYNEAAKNAGTSPVYSQEQMQRIKGYIDGTYLTEYDPANPINGVFAGRRNGNANNDWPHIIFDHTAFNQKHNINVSGGSSKTQYYLSGGYVKQNGAYAFGYDYYDRKNFLSNLSSQVTDWLKLNASVKYANSGTDHPIGQTTVNREHLFGEILTFAPMMPYYNINGTVQSPFVRLLESSGRDKANHKDFILSLGGELEPIKGWKTIVNYNYNNRNSSASINPKPVWVELGTGALGNFGKAVSSYTAEKSENTYELFNAVTSYELKANQHYFKGMIGYEQEVNTFSGLTATGTGLIADDLPSLSTALGTKTVQDNLNHWATRGVFGRLNYNYQEKYLVELSARYNGSSRFPKHNRFGFFPSGSIGYIISKESFFEPLRPYVNNFKLRASYGSLGNQNVANYLYFSKINVSPDLGWIINNARPQYAQVPVLISDDIKWETITTLNFGFDAGFVNNRLNVVFDWYNRVTDNMLGIAETLPYVLGASTPLANNAKMSTKGYELIVSWQDAINDNFSYNLKGTLGDSRSKILEYRNASGLIDDWYSGKEYGEIWGLTSDRLIQNAGEAMPDQSQYYSKWGAGDMKYVDLNGDGKVTNGKRTLDDHGDLTVIGNTQPRYNIGFSAGFRYKDFDFNMFWQGVGRQDMHPSLSSSSFWGLTNAFASSGLLKNSPALDYWRPADEQGILGPNTDAYFARPYFSVETNKNRQVQTKYLLNAGYFRMRNIQLGYNIPSSVVGKIFSKARVYFSAENLLTFTSLPKVFEPESMLASDPRRGGYTGNNGEGAIYPTTKSFSFGVNITFK